MSAGRAKALGLKPLARIRGEARLHACGICILYYCSGIASVFQRATGLKVRFVCVSIVVLLSAE